MRKEGDTIADELIAAALSQSAEDGVISSGLPRPSGIFTRRLSNALADATAKRTDGGQIDPVSREQMRLAVTRGVARGRRDVREHRKTAAGQ